MEQKKNSIKNFILLYSILFIYSLGSVFSKIAAQQEIFSLKFLLSYGMVLVIMFVYAIFWQQILKKFDLTIAFANKAVVILFGIVWGAVIFKEKISWNMIVGAIIIIIGIWMVAKDNEG